MTETIETFEDAMDFLIEAGLVEGLFAGSNFDEYEEGLPVLGGKLCK